MKSLLIIDIQNDYFPGGANALVGANDAAKRAAELLAAFRACDLPVIHIQHLSTRPGSTFFLPDTLGAEIHPCVAPKSGEPVLVKHFPSAFRDTGLDRLLQERKITELVICGMMTHMCVDTTVRAAFDLGYQCRVAHDACATKDLVFGGRKVTAEQVQAAYLAALASPFASVKPVAELVSGFESSLSEH